MQTNATPHYDQSVNTTGCCPRFNPTGWDGQILHFRDKRFVRSHTANIDHVPLNIGRVFGRVQRHLADHKATGAKQSNTLSRDLSP